MTDSKQGPTLASRTTTVPVQAKHGAPSERRYRPRYVGVDVRFLVPLVASGVCAGAGVYGHFAGESSSTVQLLLLLGFTGSAIAALTRAFATNSDVLVGDVGVAIEKGGEVTRLLWSELTSIRVEAAVLVLTAAHTSLRIPALSQTRALRAIVKEASARRPQIVEVPQNLIDDWSRHELGPEPVPEAIHALQIAGKRCVASKQVIAVERDARLCPNCASIYHRERLPAVCVTCNLELRGRGVSL